MLCPKCYSGDIFTMRGHIAARCNKCGLVAPKPMFLYEMPNLARYSGGTNGKAHGITIERSRDEDGNSVGDT